MSSEENILTHWNSDNSFRVKVTNELLIFLRNMDNTTVLPFYVIHIFLPYSFQIIIDWENPLAVSPERQRSPERLDIAQEGNLKGAGVGCLPECNMSWRERRLVYWNKELY